MCCEAAAHEAPNGSATPDLVVIGAAAARAAIGAWIDRGVAVIVVSEAGEEGLAQHPAIEWLQKPLNARHFGQVVAASIEHVRLRREVERLRQMVAHDLPASKPIARSKAMQRSLAQLSQAPFDARPLVLHGERGTGRGVLGRAVAADVCHGLVELGAAEVRADAGAEQLRELLASDRPETLLVRDADLWCAEGRQALLAALGRLRRKIIVTIGDEFPQELRATSALVHVPPLRERTEDIVPLARHFLAHYAPGARLTGDAEAELRRYTWPGNIADLRNTLERAALGGAGEVGTAQLPAHLRGPQAIRPQVGGDFTMAQIEKAHLEAVLLRPCRTSEAARILGIDDSTIWRMRKRYELP